MPKAQLQNCGTGFVGIVANSATDLWAAMVVQPYQALMVEAGRKNDSVNEPATFDCVARESVV